LIKDAQRFPVHLASLEVTIVNIKEQQTQVLHVPLDLAITENFISR